ncbi:uncharacterized protein BO97DRAFT_460082 [Aspergillus homomorphus CBS 101889]|uniref:Uncharacterized protein n=1 Tax=Aspergillus homomorphus (strain CBS 101889) TaxID=1450537 RepID=A0A395HMS3_ASPHC|nr:hypothetical protein BO97DRAFT_460082 [Aspergillus homomorphus CBS 101889]RAL08789.1 hypothetical protein BO97DRAFT_460082 [Aspergillus homomorphus CBS 101889]
MNFQGSFGDARDVRLMSKEEALEKMYPPGQDPKTYKMTRPARGDSIKVFPAQEGFRVACYIARDPDLFYGFRVYSKLEAWKEVLIQSVVPNAERLYYGINSSDFYFKTKGEENSMGQTRSKECYCRTPACDLVTDHEAFVQQLRPLRRFWRKHVELSAACYEAPHVHDEEIRVEPYDDACSELMESEYWQKTGRSTLRAAMEAPYCRVAPLAAQSTTLLAWLACLQSVFCAEDGFAATADHCSDDNED